MRHRVNGRSAARQDVKDVQTGEVRIIGFACPELAIGPDVDQIGCVTDGNFDLGRYAPLIIAVHRLIALCRNAIVDSTLHRRRVKRVYRNIRPSHAAPGTKADQTEKSGRFDRRLI